MATQDNIAISVKNVSKDFQLPHEKADSIKSLFVNPFRGKSSVEVQHALKDISFDVKKGEFFGIVGRNGSGKSTLLKIIAKIYQPTNGSVTVDGRLVPFIELGVGFNPELTGRENVFLNGALMGFSKKEIVAKYDTIVDFAELERFMDQKLKNYSSGMQVRLAFSVATILAESDILLIDEVLAVGDADFQRKCFDYFRALKKNNKTVIFVSHDMSAVMEYCDRAILVEDSVLVEEGKPSKIATLYRKMFQEQKDTHSTQTDRWGDQLLTINSAHISSEKLSDKDKDLILTFSVKANADIELPLFGFGIKAPTGNILIGTNNNIKKQQIKSLKKGDQIELRWTVPNIFSDGIHTIDLAAEYKNGGMVADRWEDALDFRVEKQERSPYIVSPNVELVIKED